MDREKLRKFMFAGLMAVSGALVVGAELTPVSFDKVKLHDTFWLERMKAQKDVLIPLAFEKTAVGLENLRIAGRVQKADTNIRSGRSFFDTSDLYKVIEGAAYLLKIERDDALEAKIDSISKDIASAMEPDGYLYPPITGKAYDKARYGDIAFGHELYNVGHLYEAAVAYYLATGKRNLLDIAEKNARHVNKAFFIGGDEKYNGGKPVNQAPGHQEIELALVKLYKATGNRLYLDMAKRFLDIRALTYVAPPKNSQPPKYARLLRPEYAQQDKPVRELREVSGHCVRACYMYAAMADVGSAAGDPTFKTALESLWADIVDTRMHITGGIGAVREIEGFGPKYVLPNETAYDETCAAIANMFFNFRMFLLELDAKYMDVAEVALLNNVLAGVNLAGDRFFYDNPLECYSTKGRSKWFGCACCPTNLARVIPQVPGMMYAYSADEAYLCLYASSQTEIPLKSGKVRIEQKSDYPLDGKVQIRVYPQKGESKFTLMLRIPSWATKQFVPGKLYYYTGKEPRQKWSLKINGEEISDVKMSKGFARIERTWRSGDTAELNLPMPVRFNKAIDEVEADRGRVALTRGPLVLCAEGIDNEAPPNAIALCDFSQTPNVERIKEGPLKGIPRASLEKANYIDAKGRWLPTKCSLIPYYAWNNRGNYPMNVWFADSRQSLEKNVNLSRVYKSEEIVGGISAPMGKGDIKSTVKKSTPLSSKDIESGGWICGENASEIVVEYEFKRVINLWEIGIYWADGVNGAKTPRSWTALYREPETKTWYAYPKYLTEDYGTLKDQLNTVKSARNFISTDAVRIVITPQDGARSGILRARFSE